MKSCVVVLLLALNTSAAVSQWTGPAWNPRCYYPEVGNRSQIDTIFGPSPNDFLGGGLLNIGPRPEESYGTIATIFPVLNGFNLPSLGSFDAGPGFDLHHLKTNKRINFRPIGQIIKIGHFRDTYHNDMLTSNGGYYAIMYWEDDQGNYDSLRMSRFAVITPYGDTITGWNPGITFCAHITSDTVYDVVFPFGIYNGRDELTDSMGIGLAPGGTYLQGMPDTVLSTMAAVIHADLNRDSSIYSRTVWDSRLGGSRAIAAIDGQGNIFYYPIGPNFSLKDLGRGLTYDTLVSTADAVGFIQPRNSRYYYSPPFEMHAFAKENGDASTDLIYPVEHEGNRYSILAFRGTSAEGEHVLTLDSAFVLHSPSDHGASDFERIPPEQVHDCGDMSGRGNRFLSVDYTVDPAYSAYCFYELGKQLDDKIDIFYIDGPLQGEEALSTPSPRMLTIFKTW